MHIALNISTTILKISKYMRGINLWSLKKEKKKEKRTNII